MAEAEERSGADTRSKPVRITDDVYEKELARMQVELVKMQEWVHHEGFKIVVIFEGRDAAGKGGV
ncbi:MAG: polyphosphate kinase 2, partial [Bryobacteraceae bacterium]